MGSIMDADSCKIVKDETDRIVHVTGVVPKGRHEEQHFLKTSNSSGRSPRLGTFLWFLFSELFLGSRFSSLLGPVSSKKNPNLKQNGSSGWVAPLVSLAGSWLAELADISIFFFFSDHVV